MKETSISLFKGYSDTHPQDSTLQEIVNLIATMHWCATAPRNTAITAITGKGLPLGESRLPVFCRCRVLRRRQAGREHHGLDFAKLADIDHIDADHTGLIGRVRADKHTPLSYHYQRCSGLRIIYRTDCLTATPEKNRKIYSKSSSRATGRYYAGLLAGCECDLKCKNITRLSGLAHDLMSISILMPLPCPSN